MTQNCYAHFQLWIKCLHSSSALGQFAVNSTNLRNANYSFTGSKTVTESNMWASSCLSVSHHIVIAIIP